MEMFNEHLEVHVTNWPDNSCNANIISNGRMRLRKFSGTTMRIPRNAVGPCIVFGVQFKVSSVDVYLS